MKHFLLRIKEIIYNLFLKKYSIRQLYNPKHPKYNTKEFIMLRHDIYLDLKKKENKIITTSAALIEE